MQQDQVVMDIQYDNEYASISHIHASDLRRQLITANVACENSIFQ